MKRMLIAGVLLGTFLLANTLWGAKLPAPLREVKPELRPLGTATLNWFVLHVYDIALFAQDTPYTTSSNAVLSIRYNISIKSKRLQETTLEEWRRMKMATEIQRERWIKQLDSIWPDVNPGDRLTAFKRKGGPTQFYYGDQLLGEVSDPAFGPAFFAIWLDADCKYPKIRDQLLRIGAKERK
jgi:hypothetical protein